MKISKPVRVRRTYTQTIEAPPDVVFPLLCPVREVEWVRGWNPRLVISGSGVVEPGCVFVMPERPIDSIWVVTRWEPDHHHIEFVKVMPDLAVGRIEITLAAPDGGRTHAEISYEYTALGPSGEEFVRSFTEGHFEGFMEQWESELNQFLQAG